MTYCLTKGELKSLPRCICKQIFSGVLFSCLHFNFSIADLDGLSNHYSILKRIKSLKNANLDRYANSCVLLKSQPTQNVNKKIRLLEKSDSKPHYGTQYQNFATFLNENEPHYKNGNYNFELFLSVNFTRSGTKPANMNYG